MRFAFVGGTYRGFELIKELVKHDAKPLAAFILKEDDHETEIISKDIIGFLEEQKIKNSCKKKLTKNDYDLLKTLQLDFIFVCGWRTIIDPVINEYLKLGMFAAHDSLLPAYRGFAPVNWAIINGEKETGVTLFKIDEGEVDSGNIYGQKKVEILDNDYGWDVYLKITKATVELYQEFIDKYKNNSLISYEQDEAGATYTCKRTPQDGKINWNKPSTEIYNLIRALAFPYPGSFCMYNNSNFYIRKATPGKNNHKKYIGKVPGRVIAVYENGVEIMCNEGTILIEEWEQKEEQVIEVPSVRIRSITSTLL